MIFRSHSKAICGGIRWALALSATLFVSASASRAQRLISSTGGSPTGRAPTDTASTNLTWTAAFDSPSAPRRVLHLALLSAPQAAAPPSAPQAATPFVEFAASLSPAEPQQAPPPPQALPGPFLGRFEVSQWGSSVSNGFGNW